MNTKIDRKKFLKITGLAAIGMAGLGVLKTFKDDILKTKKSPSKSLFKSVKNGEIKLFRNKSRVSISAVESDIEDAVAKAALSATDFSWLKKGQTVFIKPVVNSGNKYPATTHPSAIAAMIKLLKSKGAGRVIVGDMSGIEFLKFFKDKTRGSTRELMKKTGILDAVIAAGGEPHFFEEPGWDAFYKDHTGTREFFKNGLMMPNILKEADHIVLMPRCSRHILAGSSLGMKAVVGYWRTDSRLEYHINGNELHEKTAEGNRADTLVQKLRLVISAADKLLATIGPDDGYVYKPEQGIVIASESLVSHDMVSLAWLLYNRKLLPEDKQNMFADTSRGISKSVNTIVIKMLGGSMAQAIMSEPLFKNDLKTIWDDRVLNHAYRVFGGVPEVELINTDNMVKKDILKKLKEMTQLTLS